MKPAVSITDIAIIFLSIWNFGGLFVRHVTSVEKIYLSLISDDKKILTVQFAIGPVVYVNYTTSEPILHLSHLTSAPIIPHP